MRVRWKSEREGFATFAAELKAGGEGSEDGVFEAYVAIFNTPDRPDFFGDSDIIDPGAFTATLQEKGLPPIVWGHNWDVPPIGHSLKAVEDGKGLRITGKLFTQDEGISGQYAKSVYTGMTSTPPVVKEFSFAFEAQEWSDERKDGRFIRHLKKVELFEVGPVLVGRHPDTELIGAKGIDGPPRRLPAVDGDAVRAVLLKRIPEFANAEWEQALAEGKAGARNSGSDKSRLNDIFDKAEEIKDLAVANGAER